MTKSNILMICMLKRWIRQHARRWQPRTKAFVRAFVQWKDE